MARINLIIATLSFVLVSFLGAANSRNVFTDSSQVIQTNEVNLVVGESTKTWYLPDHSDSSVLRLSYAFYLPASGTRLTPYQKSVNELIYENTMWETFGQVDEDHSSAEVISQEFFNHRLERLFTEMKQGSPEALNQLYELEMHTSLTEFDDYVALTISGWSYTGGAHGNSYVMHYLIDRTTGEKLKLSDVFSDLEGLNDLAEEEFRMIWELSPEESLSDAGFWFDEDRFQVNENFSVDKDQVTFYYNQYEISPYVFGPTEITIPLDAVSPFLNKNFHK